MNIVLGVVLGLVALALVFASFASTVYLPDYLSWVVKALFNTAVLAAACTVGALGVSLIWPEAHVWSGGLGAFLSLLTIRSCMTTEAPPLNY